MDYHVSSSEEKILVSRGFVRVTGLSAYRRPPGFFSAFFGGLVSGMKEGWNRGWSYGRSRRSPDDMVIGETCCAYANAIAIRKGMIAVYSPGGDVWVRAVQPSDRENLWAIISAALSVLSKEATVDHDLEVPRIDWCLKHREDLARRTADPFCEPTKA